MLNLVVSRLTTEADGVRGVELRRPDGAALPAFTPGAHIDVHFPTGLVRQYSLSNAASETSRYCLGIGLAPASRGGSSFAHESLHEGDTLQVGAPRSLFRLNEEAPAHLFIAGGIGITPILSMIRWCIEHGREWELLYCVRSRKCAAYLDVLAAFPDRVLLHADDEHAGARADLESRVNALQAAAHLYCCGPGALMNAVAAQASKAGIDPNAVHFERFAAEPDRERADSDSAFTVTLHRHGGRFIVPAGESILSVLEANGVCTPFSCREGLCRTCKVPLLSGAADHRDYVLSDEEREAQRTIMICVSRARSEELVLDL